jgi:hypothetical protein
VKHTTYFYLFYFLNFCELVIMTEVTNKVLFGTSVSLGDSHNFKSNYHVATMRALPSFISLSVKNKTKSLILEYVSNKKKSRRLGAWFCVYNVKPSVPF